MEGKGTLKNVTKNWLTGKFELTFEMEGDIGRQIDSMKDKLLNIAVKQYRKKRSLDANGYYWQLLTRLSEKLNLSKPHLHNILLRRYGQPEVIDGQMVYLVLPDSDSGARKADEAETYHIRPTSQVKTGKDGLDYRTYVMLRGSSTYDTREMSELINGLVTECQEQGIDTLSPGELERIMLAYDSHWRKRHEETV